MNLKSIRGIDSLVIYKDSKLVDAEEKAKELIKLFIDKEDNLNALLQMLQTYIEYYGHFEYIEDDMKIASIEL